VQVQLQVEQEISGLSYSRTKNIPNIKPNSSQTVDIPISATDTIKSAQVKLKVEGVAAYGNISVMSATQGAQIASSYPEKKHGLFTYCLLKGISGDADDGDKKLMIEELYKFVKARVETQAGNLDRSQTPDLQGIREGVKLIEY